MKETHKDLGKKVQSALKTMIELWKLPIGAKKCHRCVLVVVWQCLCIVSDFKLYYSLLLGLWKADGHAWADICNNTLYAHNTCCLNHPISTMTLRRRDSVKLTIPLLDPVFRWCCWWMLFVKYSFQQGSQTQITREVIEHPVWSVGSQPRKAPPHKVLLLLDIKWRAASNRLRESCLGGLSTLAYRLSCFLYLKQI